MPTPHFGVAMEDHNGIEITGDHIEIDVAQLEGILKEYALAVENIGFSDLSDEVREAMKFAEQLFAEARAERDKEKAGLVIGGILMIMSTLRELLLKLDERFSGITNLAIEEGLLDIEGSVYDDEVNNQNFWKF